jgi:hypothetical protein
VDTVKRIALLLVAPCVCACSSLGGGGGGADNLPNRGIVPYDRLVSTDDDGPRFVLESEDPSALIYVEPNAVNADNDTIILFAEARVPAETTGHIVRCALDEALRCDDAVAVLVPSEDEGDWLNQRVGAPSVLPRADGDWLMVFAFGQGDGIGLAKSLDGVEFVMQDLPLLEPSGTYEAGGIDSPSVIRTPTGYRVYYEARGEDGLTRILYADADDSLTFERVGVALDVGTGCDDVSGQPEACWDDGGVGSPEVRVATTATGRTVYRLFYTGLGDSGFDLGFGASWDGQRFERFVYNPVIATEAVERQPTNLRLLDRYILLFEERTSNSVRGIAAAINDAPVPSEHF